MMPLMRRKTRACVVPYRACAQSKPNDGRAGHAISFSFRFRSFISFVRIAFDDTQSVSILPQA